MEPGTTDPMPAPPQPPVENNAARSSVPSGGAVSTNHPGDAQQLQQVMAELRQLGEMDPAVADQLMADLEQTDPALWPTFLHQARALVAYRAKLAERTRVGGLAAGGPNPPADPASTGDPRGPNPSLRDPLGNPAGPHHAAMGPAYGRQLTADTEATQPAAFGQSTTPPVAEQVRRASQAGGRSDAGEVIDVARLPAAGAAALPPRDAPGQPYPQTTAQVEPRAAGHGSAGERLESAGRVGQQDASPDGAPRADGADKRLSGQGPPERTPTESERRWQEYLADAIARLEQEAEHPTDDAERALRHARLRMLYLAAGRHADAVRPIPGASSRQQEFWSNELHGLGALMSSPASWDAAGRMAEAKQVLDRALARLGESAPLVVRNLAFCTAVHSYGCFQPFPKYEFEAEQRVLLYAEVENFAVEETAEGYHTALRSSYQIFDAQGHRIADRDLTLNEETCRNRRRDFFIVYDFRLPKRIYPGKHTLRLTVEDMKSQKIGQSAIELTIKESP